MTFSLNGFHLYNKEVDGATRGSDFSDTLWLEMMRGQLHYGQTWAVTGSLRWILFAIRKLDRSTFSIAFVNIVVDFIMASYTFFFLFG